MNGVYRMNILDRIILPKETKNLIRINKLHGEINLILNGSKLKSLINELSEIKTVEHGEKIDLILYITKLWQK